MNKEFEEELVLRCIRFRNPNGSIRLDASKQYHSTSSLVLGYALCSILLINLEPLAESLRLFDVGSQLRMTSFFKLLKIPRNSSSIAIGLKESSKLFSTGGFGDTDANERGKGGLEIDDDDFLADKPDLKLQTVDPKKGWNFRGVHKAIVCGKVGQAPVQKILRNGRTVTVFTVGTGGMYDQRQVGATDLPKPAQWHRIAVHNPMLGAYAVQQLVKNSSVYVEGELETRVYNDSINGDIKSIPEIVVRRDGRVRLIKGGQSASNISIDELREGLL